MSYLFTTKKARKNWTCRGKGKKKYRQKSSCHVSFLTRGANIKSKWFPRDFPLLSPFHFPAATEILRVHSQNIYHITKSFLPVHTSSHFQINTCSCKSQVWPVNFLILLFLQPMKCRKTKKCSHTNSPYIHFFFSLNNTVSRPRPIGSMRLL